MKRKYYEANFKVEDKRDLERASKKLLSTKIKNLENLEELIKKYSELSVIIEETFAWKYIKMTCNVEDKDILDTYNNYYKNVYTFFYDYSFEINKKIYKSEYFKNLNNLRYENYKKILSNSIEMYDKRNIKLSIEENKLKQKYMEIMASLTVNYENRVYTLSQMKKFLEDKNRKTREKAWKLIQKKRIEKSNELNEIFDNLQDIRNKMAENKDFENYRDYMHKLKGRFSYSPSDIYDFHKSIETEIVPIIKKLNNKKAKDLKFKNLKPWDDIISGENVELKPFNEMKDFLQKVYIVLEKINPKYKKNLENMEKNNYLDLENRKGKSPGGYNYPLHESGMPFIFMNSVGTHKDVVTLFHESGHAMHSYAADNEILIDYKETPPEIAEVASMTMELFSMNYWEVFYRNENELKKAKKDQLLRVLNILPWVMIIDAYQQEIYTRKNTTKEEREEIFGNLMDRYNVGINWDGFEKEKKNMWLEQLHIFEVPFYYIEYAISQLAAIAIYKNYKKDKEQTLINYQNFLESGYSKPLKETYKIAGIEFNFSKPYIKELADFIEEELENI